MKLLLFASFLTLGAHEIGTTRATASFTADRRYVIQITTDPENLAEKLDGAPAQTLLTRIQLQFDGVPFVPSLRHENGTIQLTGLYPAGAKTFQFRYGWTFTTYSLTVDGRTLWIEGGDTTDTLPLIAAPAETAWQLAARYLGLGFTHILPHGLDHVLFVLGLCLLSLRTRTLLLQVTAFTLAHSITLGLSMYGLVRVSPSVVEPLIALSIAYVAIENIFLRELKPWRLALIFVFGLLHGLGFAGVLSEAGMPASSFFTALLSFNAGVEAGQLAVIALAAVAFGRFHAKVATPASAAIALAALYWTIERIAA
ncbi:MAG: HupE/UreJ family protein [Acidobacteria bacterium]|nr:HupE/UreJ family protein [Acidobacteriota bacterium]